MFVKLFILGPSITTNKELPIHFSPRFNYFLLDLEVELHFSQLFHISFLNYLKSKQSKQGWYFQWRMQL